MDIKKITNSILVFIIKKLIEIFGILVSILGILLFIALVTHSPNDPNFIFPENTEINNLLGFQGSYVSDLFLQSFGVITHLIPITLIFTGYFIFKRKDAFLIIENVFYSILYCLFGSLFFEHFHQDNFS